MIGTVTLNTALDRLLFVRQFRMGRRIVAERSMTSVGGKGTVVSCLLRQLAAETRAYGFAAGPNGHVLCTLLDAATVPYEFVEAEGDTRVNTVIVDGDAADQTTVIAESLRVTEAHVERLETVLRSAAKRASVWVLSGSLPPGAPPELWARLVAILSESGAKVLLDSSGDGLRHGVASRPYLIKPNLPELEELCGRSLPSPDHVRDAAESVLAMGPERVIVTMGEAGLLAVERGVRWFIPPVEVPVASTSGAGDGVVTGIALGLERNTTFVDAVRLGAAVAASVVSQPGTAVCVPSDVERYFRGIRPEPLDD